MTPAEIRTLMTRADQRPTTTAQAMEQARAEGMLSSWRAWLPGLLNTTPDRAVLLDAAREAIATSPSAWSEQEPLGSRMDRREIYDAAENVVAALLPLLSIRPSLASPGERAGGTMPNPAGAHSHVARCRNNLSALLSDLPQEAQPLRSLDEALEANFRDGTLERAVRLLGDQIDPAASAVLEEAANRIAAAARLLELVEQIARMTTEAEMSDAEERGEGEAMSGDDAIATVSRLIEKARTLTGITQYD